MPLTCLSCFSIRGDRRESLVPKHEMRSPCSTRAPVVEEYRDALSDPGEDDPCNFFYHSRLEYFRELCRDDTFIVSENSGTDVELSYRPRGTDPLIARGRLSLANSRLENLNEISNLILDNSKRHLWDSDLYEIETLERKSLSATESIVRVWVSYKGQYGFQGRDFFWDIYVRVTEDEIVHITTPGEDDGMNRYPGRFVRGRTLIGGLWITKKPESNVEMVLINQTDVFGGSSSSKRLLPDWIIDSVMKKSPMKLNALKAFITSSYTSI